VSYYINQMEKYNIVKYTAVLSFDSGLMTVYLYSKGPANAQVLLQKKMICYHKIWLEHCFSLNLATEDFCTEKSVMEPPIKLLYMKLKTSTQINKNNKRYETNILFNCTYIRNKNHISCIEKWSSKTNMPNTCNFQCK
jgi:hypothetical protein